MLVITHNIKYFGSDRRETSVEMIAASETRIRILRPPHFVVGDLGLVLTAINSRAFHAKNRLAQRVDTKVFPNIRVGRLRPLGVQDELDRTTGGRDRDQSGLPQRRPSISVVGAAAAQRVSRETRLWEKEAAMRT